MIAASLLNFEGTLPVASNKTRTDPYKNFKFRLVLGAAVAGIAAYLAGKALIRSGGRRPRRPALSRLVRVDPAKSRGTWDDLRLPPDQVGQLRRLAEEARRRSRVEERNVRGTKGQHHSALTALFAGPAGTGKSMAAQVLAAGLGVDLYRVDTSAVVSKYIGETEKNLQRVFDAAEASGAVLMFDEADALFGKRTGVKDSHDRYANIEGNYLLRRMEDHDGPVILTSNRKQNIDAAFLRRLRYIVEYGSPFESPSPKKSPRRRRTIARKPAGD